MACIEHNDAATGAATDFDPAPNGPVRSLAAGTDGTLDAGGDFTSLEQSPQMSIAAFGP